jgi:hypothetical protein
MLLSRVRQSASALRRADATGEAGLVIDEAKRAENARIAAKLIADNASHKYPTLTWRQFKDAVDAELAEIGVPEDIEIWYIDFHGESKPPSVRFADDCMGISIW